MKVLSPVSHRPYLVALNLIGKPCLVVGGGWVAAGKVEGLLKAGASVTVVSPDLVPALARKAEEHRIDHRPRLFAPSDLEGCFLAVSATDDSAVNDWVVREARRRQVLASSADGGESDFSSTAVVERGELRLAVSTGGRSPAFARWVGEQLEEDIPAGYGALLEIAGQLRAEFSSGSIPPYSAWREALSADVLALVQSGNHDAARDLLRSRLLQAASPPANQRLAAD
jgi:precorrin-2 dehydrogenase/sirohydrochlorin ferrochelatase